MEQFDRENSSNYVKRPEQPGERTDVSEPVLASAPVAPVSPQKPKRSSAALVLSLLLILALLAVAALAWLWYQQSGEIDNVRTDLSASRNKVSQLESDLKAQKAIAADTKEDAVTKPVSDKDQLIALAKAYDKAQASGSSAIKITVAKLQLPFARVDVSAQVGGAACVYKKVDGLWLWLYCAQGGSEDTMRMDALYGVPKSIIES